MYGKSSRSAHERNPFVCVLILLLAIASVAEAFCPDQLYWDFKLDSCVECTKCEGNSIVLRPCRTHGDTVCGSFSDLDYDFRVYATREQQQLNHDSSRNYQVIEQSNMDFLSADWQMVAFALAAFACLLFFVAAACMFWQHTKYWKKVDRMDRGYRADAEELSSRLMHTIIDIRNDENGRVVLEEARKDKIENPLNLRCIYFEELLNNQTNAKAIVTKPLVKNSDSNKKEEAMQHKADGDDRSGKERGNCYTEPTQTRDNCVTSELYLIT